MNCSVGTCSRRAVHVGMCNAHYQRSNLFGDPQADKPLRERLPKSASAEERFWFYVERADGCWRWRGAKNTGYGTFWTGKRQMPAHRFAYELLVGPIPAGFQVDHVCHPDDGSCIGDENCPHRQCTNPDHLRACTQAENTSRSTGVSAREAKQTHCLNGHPLDAAWRRTNGRTGRQCRICDRDRKRAKRRAS